MHAMDETSRTSLTIIGGGHVGKTLGRLWRLQQTFAIQDVLCRSIGHAHSATAFIGAGRAVDDFSSLQSADVYLLSVPDDQIIAWNEQITKTGLLLASSIVFHCNGSLPSTAGRAAGGGGGAGAGGRPGRGGAM